MIYAITYSDQNYIRSAKLNAFTAKHIGGADKVKIYSPDDLGDNFKRKNKELLSCKKGAGYWIWKPYIMLDMLSKMRGGVFNLPRRRCILC